jgi:Primase C terminal 1 (PriCT-1)
VNVAAPAARLTTEAFFEALFAGSDGGVVELRALPSKATHFSAVADPAVRRGFIARYVPRENLYLGVAVRKDGSSGAAENLAALGALFVDLDFKHTPELETREKVAAFPVQPTLVVHTGGGLHVYYGLREPFALADDAARDSVKTLLRRLGRALGGDLSAAEPARVLRVPGTFNHKPEYGTPRPVVLELCEPSGRYNLSELEEWLPPAPPEDSPGTPFEMPVAKVGQGERNALLFRLARSLKAKGLTPAAILAAARAENQAKCDPPHDETEVQRAVHSALSQPDRPWAGPAASPGRRGTAPDDDHWPKLAPEALYGLPGQVVAAIDKYTEADRVATLLTFLVAAGNLLGAGPHAQAGEDRHPGRLYAALVGESSKGRKGMSWRAVLRLLAMVDAPWARTRIASGLSSGEGVIYHVRDPREERQPIKERSGRVIDYQTVIVDPGVEDKRLLVEEPELASVLRRMDRESNSLSAVLRQAWDDGNLGTLTKNSPLRATGAHVSLLAHVTRAELVVNLGATERVNGFGNRFLYALVRRSKELPDPAPIPLTVLPAPRGLADRGHDLGAADGGPGGARSRRGGRLGHDRPSRRG